MCERVVHKLRHCLHFKSIQFTYSINMSSIVCENTTIPERSQWFHGLIDRKTAEERLRASKRVNVYLVRESTHSHTHNYVLSYLGTNSTVNHFRVQHICGHYYIGAKHFPSLDHLIHFYTFCADLLQNERLLAPISAPQPLVERSVRRVVSVLPYTKMPDTDELSFKRGDVFVVHNDHNGWLWVTNDRTLESGLVFNELMEQLDDQIDPNEVYPWFHSRITKQEAVDKLARAGPGSFLVRPSDNSPGNYSLFFHVANAVQRFRIERKGQRYSMGGRVFQSLEEVIERYKSEQIVEGFRLKTPVAKAVFEETRWTSDRAKELKDRTDVYQTLRESRDAQKRNQSILMSGYLSKKSQKHKKWKNYFFVLNAKQTLLFYYENERKTRPKGVVDLNYSYVYIVHDSLFERNNCFQVVERALPCISTHYYLSANDVDTCRQWTSAIHSLCASQHALNTQHSHIVQRPNSGGGGEEDTREHVSQESSSRAREMRSLFISLLEANGLPVKCCANPFVIIAFNANIKVAKSQVKCPPDPIWEEDFLLDDIPSDVNSFSLVLVNRGKHRSKDTEIAETTIELTSLRSGDECEQWLPLSGLCPPIRESWGQLKARIRFTSELIMPFNEYSALKELILIINDLEVISVCEHFATNDRHVLANALLTCAKYERKECALLTAMIAREVEMENEVSTLFRANSLTTALIDVYLRSICHSFVRKSLYDCIQRVLDSKNSCELNPSKLDTPLEACQNAEHLLDVLDTVVEAIFARVDDCPQNLRFICHALQTCVAHKWPRDPLVRTRVVGGFVFLRLLCPAILNPRQFSLTNETPSETAARTLILIAKSIQNLSNLVEFGSKSIFLSGDRFTAPPLPNSKREPWMEVVNPFILKNKSKMIKFLDDLSDVNECTDHTTTTTTTTNTNIDEPSRELAYVHSLCERHRDEIAVMSTNKPTLKKLLTVLDLLTKRKTRFNTNNQ